MFPRLILGLRKNCDQYRLAQQYCAVAALERAATVANKLKNGERAEETERKVEFEFVGKQILPIAFRASGLARIHLFAAFLLHLQ